MKRLFITFILLFCSGYVAANASNDFKAAFKESKKSNHQTASILFESGLNKIESGESLPSNDILNAKVGLAVSYVAIGKIKKARALIHPLMDELENTGPRDLYVAGVQLLFYIHFLSQEDTRALEQLALFIVLQKEYPKQFPATARALSFLQQAIILDRNGKALSAISSQQNVIKLYKQALPSSSNELINAYTTLVTYSEKVGEHAVALAGLKAKLELMVPQKKIYEFDISKTRIRIDAVEKRLAQQGPDVDNPHGIDFVERLAKHVNIDVVAVQKNLIKARETFGDDSPVTVSAYTIYADALASIGEIDYALQMYEIAREKLVRLYGLRNPNLASLYINRANAKKHRFSFDLDITDDVRSNIIDDYNRAINIYAEIYGDAHPLTISALYTLYELERLKNDYAIIFKIAKRLFTAYSEYEKNSFTYLGRKQKLAFREQYKDIGQRFIEASWLTQAKPPGESWFGDPYPDIDFSKPDWKADHDKKVIIYKQKQAQKAADKQRPLADAFEAWINHKGSISAVDNTLTLAQQQTDDPSLRNKINLFFTARKKIAQLASNGDNWERQQQERDKLQKQIDSVLIELYKDIPELSLDKKITIDDLKNKIPKKSIYLDFVKLYTYQYAVFSLDASGRVRIIRLGDDPISIEQRVQKIRNLINDTIDGNIDPVRSKRLLKKELAEFYKKCIWPISGLIDGFDELIISAEGLLALMPMGLLYNEDSQQYLIEQHSIRTVPSARALIRKNYSQEIKQGSAAAIFADPDFDLGLTTDTSVCTKTTATSRALTASVLRNFDKPCIGRLPATAKEAYSINAAMNNNGDTYLQSQATEDALRKIVHPEILHIATHGFFLPDPEITNPLEKSGLILSGANAGIADKSGKGVVTGLKLATMDLRGTKLVVLSACETGVGDIEQGEGVAGLNQAFLRAGAKGVVMSLWRVPDVQTAELMKRLYGEIDKGISPVEALRAAQRSFIKDGQHPLAWAAFAYSG